MPSISEIKLNVEVAISVDDYETDLAERRKALDDKVAARMSVDVSTLPITGELSRWWVHTYDDKGSQVVWGLISNDAAGRFRDNTEIRTSKVVKIEGDIAVTANSAYRLVGPAARI